MKRIIIAAFIMLVLSSVSVFA
ncbi:MAG: lipoprotein [Bacteroidales bacterium]|nr:lipoprotein [Bacteroidales bacterium]